MPKTTYKSKKLSASELTVKIVSGFTLLFYLYCVLSITLIDRTAGMRRHVFTPLWEVRTMLQSGNYRYWTGQIGGNLIMLFPLGFLLPIMSERFRSFMLTAATGFAFSVLIEFTQFYTGRGLFESDDIMHNTIGACAGCIAYLMVEKLLDIQTDYEDTD